MTLNELKASIVNDTTMVDHIARIVQSAYAGKSEVYFYYLGNTVDNTDIYKLTELQADYLRKQGYGVDYHKHLDQSWRVYGWV